ncbi:SpoIIE family protein phosphatase [Marinactinospora thermotolerans]|uniref:SpoIIE family protein phosphatase n=1 Tax=Marinactinospora thermotolerans TaxID=531310 RepID=UPI003D93F489
MSEAPATVLVVDDTLTKRYVYSTWLRRSGHTVLEASSGGEALRELAEREIDLVVLDVRLPDMSGFEVCERIKADPATAALPVLQVSASAISVADRAHGLSRGADVYMTDPIEPEEFLATVDAALRYSRARLKAENKAGLLTLLTRTTLAMNTARSFEELTATAVNAAGEIFGQVAVVLEAPDGRVVGARPGGGSSTASFECDATALFDGIAGGATGPVRFSAEQWAAVSAGARLPGPVQAAIAHGGEGRGRVCVAVGTPGRGADELDVMHQLAEALALAAGTLHSYLEERAIALTLQHSFLPRRLPQVPGMDLAVRYEPADDQVEIGGDFYEVLWLEDRLLIAIGDVQGHSLYAATVMAELRHALRACVLDDQRPGVILSRLNRVLSRYYPDQTATVCLVLVDPATRRIEIANAGHIPPLLVGDGAAAYAGTGGVLLGTPVDRAREEAHVLPPGGAVLLVTDGLVEDRSVPIDDNLDALGRLARSMGEDLEAFGDRVLGHFGRREDDSALVIARFRD